MALPVILGPKPGGGKSPIELRGLITGLPKALTQTRLSISGGLLSVISMKEGPN